ncbi:transposase [Skermanella aerolata]|uniref:transposase n=1 Tax=Skermanella aerolata TaxID=393310 RepID=UPI003D1BB43F
MKFKEEAVRLVTSGERVATVARNLGLSEQTLHNWVKASRISSFLCNGKGFGDYTRLL